MFSAYQKHLNRLQHTSKYRHLPAVQDCKIANNLDFANNDYLCLSQEKALLDAAIQAGESYGVGSSGSRLLSGNNALISSLEQQIAEDKKTEAALVFQSGFQANISVLSALLNPKILQSDALVFFDKLNHASLYQAVFLSQATLIRYPHLNMEALSQRLNQYKEDPRPKFIVSETLFGMDGDLLPIQDIAMLAKKHAAFLYFDEAHATGIFGINGYGLSTTVDLSTQAYLIMGTFSKALGSTGGYIACPNLVKDYLINTAQGFVYSTAPSPLNIGVNLKAWLMLKDMTEQRQQLLNLANMLRQELALTGFNIGNSQSHILPIILNSSQEAFQLTQKLANQGIRVSYIRPPTVPANACRIRIALNTHHTLQDIQQLIEALKSS